MFSAIKDAVGKYALVKTLLKSLPKILVSIYSIAIIISFLPSGATVLDNSRGIRYIVDFFNHIGLSRQVAQVNDFTSQAENGGQLWIFYLLSFLVASSTSYYLRDLYFKIKKHSDITRIIFDPPESSFVLAFSIAGLIDYVRIDKFHSSFFVFYNAPLLLILFGVIYFLWSKIKNSSSSSDDIESSENWPTLGYVWSIIWPVLLSFVIVILFAPILMVLLLCGFVGAPKNS